jgi:hypothetical protein
VSNFALEKYTSEARVVWDSVVKKSKNGNFLHQRDYMDYHAHRFDEQSVIVEKNGKQVAVFPCNRSKDKIVSHGGLTYGGLIYGNDLRAVEVLEILSLLTQYYGQMGASGLIYKAIPHIFSSFPAEEDLYALFRLGARLVRRDISSVIQMENRIKLSDSRKSTIRKAEKQGVEIREGDFFEAYHALLSQALSKFESQPVHTWQEMQLLKSRFPDTIRLFGTFKGEDLLAGTIIYDFGHVVHTQYLASSEIGREIGALDYVLAHLLDNSFNDRRYFSFGISTEQDGHYLNEGLIFQKEGFGGRGVVHDFYELDLVLIGEL